jgi:hypothetical protein
MSKRPWLWLLGVGGGVVGALILSRRRRSYSFGRPDTATLSRDPKLLLPSFADTLEVLFQRMRARGFDPCLHEGYRTPARAAELDRQGKGKSDSLHIYGAAADIVSCSTQWSDPKFFRALGAEAEALGLTWGGRFMDGDSNHVQAVPYEAENELRVSTNPDVVAKRFVG